MIRTYLNTIRYLKPAQMYHRVHRKRPRTGGVVDVRQRARKHALMPCISRAPAQTAANCFRFLNQEREIRTWNDPGIPKLWLYNLHYFEYAEAALIERWIRENPVGCGNGWEPYPLAIRIVNWIKWALGGQMPGETVLRSLALQAEYLSNAIEHHLSANHLLADAIALAAAGIFFDGERGLQWLKAGTALLRAEIEEQVLADGAHYERSPMYHALVLESLLDLVNISRVYELPLEAHDALWTSASSAMLQWLAMLTHPDGRIAFFNDAAFGVAPEPESLFEYAARLGIRPREECAAHASGYVRLARGETVLLLDAGAIGPDHQPGHAHADTLSFELSHRGRRVLVNSGTSTYEAGPVRQWQRGTAAHNTVRIDGEDQSEMWGAFRVARRARVLELKTDGETFVEAAHDGYMRLADPVVHRRRVDLEAQRLLVTDRIEGRGNHRVELFLHFHPDASPSVVLDKKFDGLMVPSPWYPEFNRSIPNTTVVGTWTGFCPVEFVTAIHLS